MALSKTFLRLRCAGIGKWNGSGRAKCLASNNNSNKTLNLGFYMGNELKHDVPSSKLIPPHQIRDRAGDLREEAINALSKVQFYI